jgi:hypothetical protein
MINNNDNAHHQRELQFTHLRCILLCRKVHTVTIIVHCLIQLLTAKSTALTGIATLVGMKRVSAGSMNPRYSTSSHHGAHTQGAIAPTASAAMSLSSGLIILAVV